MTTAELLRAIQHRTARVRDQQLEHARGGKYWQLPPAPVSTCAHSALVTTAASVQNSTAPQPACGLLPENARLWGLTRKGLNIFLRDCL